jgi:uridine kinase
VTSVTPEPIGAGTRIADVLPRVLDGALVVAGSTGNRIVSLAAAVPDGESVEPLTTRTPEGREIFRRSAGLALLEAARRVGAPPLRIGPTLRTSRLVTFDVPADAAAWAPALERAVQAIVAADEPFVAEVARVEDAERDFAARGWREAVALLDLRREHTVELLRLGETRALKVGVVLPSTGALGGITLAPHASGLLLDFGPVVRSELEPRAVSTLVLEQRAPRYGAEMTRGQREWLEPLGVTSVGTFSRACVEGRLSELVFVSEGFHEKHLAQLADEVKARGTVRVLAIAGPSSSGKTTFIKRIKVQLEVVGLHPWELSLDDYYVDRERTVRDATGAYDFEAVEALDLDVLAAHFTRLMTGDEVRPPRFDFLEGKSRVGAGAPIRLGPRDILLVEGIHALNPRILAAIEPDRIFRAFVHPASSIPFDRLTTLEPSDVRLLRRIVRDRHQRGHRTADTLARWASVRRGERKHIEPFLAHADRVFDTSLVYEPSVLKVFAERYLLEVPRGHPQRGAASRLRALLEPFVPIGPDHVPPTSILREFIGGSGFTY